MGRYGSAAVTLVLVFGFAVATDVAGQDRAQELPVPIWSAPELEASGPGEPLLPPANWLDPSGSGLMETPAEVGGVEGERIVVESESIPAASRWMEPWSWFPWGGWENSAELGLNGATGNTESMTLQTGARFKRKTDLHLFDLRLLQNRTHNAGVTAQNNALLYADYERSLGESPWNLFLKQGLEYDELRAFDLRYFINSGFGYRWIDTEGLLLSTRFGAGASRDYGGVDDEWTPEALFGITYEHQVNPRNKLVAKVDYFPAWEDFSDYRTISDLGWEFLLSELPNLSLKLGAVHRHDSQPGEARPNDLNYSALLLYKF